MPHKTGIILKKLAARPETGREERQVFRCN
jgi:hypothetical protein